MTPPVNVSWMLLDAPVVRGHADDVVLRGSGRDWTHARLLEEVAALGGVLRHLGVGPGVAVPVDLPDDVDAVVASLAVARLGGTVSRPAAGSAGSAAAVAPVAVVGSESAVSAGVRLVRGPAGERVPEPDLDWAVFLPAGRTDPAPCAVLDPASPYSTGPEGRTTAEELTLLRDTAPPYDAAELRALLQV